MDDGRAADDPRPPTHDAAPVMTPTEARQARPAHVARYVLGIGLVVVVIAFLAIYFGYTPPGA
jgi:hypothetical protein